VHERVMDSGSPQEMVFHVEMFLGARLDTVRPPHPVQTAAMAMLRPVDAIDVRVIAADNDLSVRQFERVFLEQIGIGPKLFARIVRFAHTLQAKSENPERTWTDVASAAGYYDQAHFIRDYHTFGGEGPSSLIETWMDCRP
jgi:transcriptional regulator GlxA family with amidase domain